MAITATNKMTDKEETGTTVVYNQSIITALFGTEKKVYKIMCWED